METRTILERLKTIECNYKESCEEHKSQCLQCMNNRGNKSTLFIDKATYNAVARYMENR